MNNPTEKTFTVDCEFQGHYQETPLTMTVPLEKLQLAGSIEFEMVYHVGRMNFETINMIQSDTRQHIGTAKFTAAARRQARAAASNAPQAAAAAGGAARVNNHK